MSYTFDMFGKLLESLSSIPPSVYKTRLLIDSLAESVIPVRNCCRTGLGCGREDKGQNCNRTLVLSVGIASLFEGSVGICS